MSSGIISMAISAISLLVVLFISRCNGKASEKLLDEAERNARQARSEAAKATAERDAAKVQESLSKRAAERIVQLIRGYNRTDSQLAELEDQLQNARDRNDIDAAVEVARKQAERAVQLGMKEKENDSI